MPLSDDSTASATSDDSDLDEDLSEVSETSEVSDFDESDQSSDSSRSSQELPAGRPAVRLSAGVSFTRRSSGRALPEPPRRKATSSPSIQVGDEITKPQPKSKPPARAPPPVPPVSSFRLGQSRKASADNLHRPLPPSRQGRSPLEPPSPRTSSEPSSPRYHQVAASPRSSPGLSSPLEQTVGSGSHSSPHLNPNNIDISGPHNVRKGITLEDLMGSNPMVKDLLPGEGSSGSGVSFNKSKDGSAPFKKGHSRHKSSGSEKKFTRSLSFRSSRNVKKGAVVDPRSLTVSTKDDQNVSSTWNNSGNPSPGGGSGTGVSTRARLIGNKKEKKSASFKRNKARSTTSPTGGIAIMPGMPGMANTKQMSKQLQKRQQVISKQRKKEAEGGGGGGKGISFGRLAGTIRAKASTVSLDSTEQRVRLDGFVTPRGGANLDGSDAGGDWKTAGPSNSGVQEASLEEVLKICVDTAADDADTKDTLKEEAEVTAALLSVTEDMPKQRWHKNQVLNELLSTEKDYCKDLRFLGKLVREMKKGKILDEAGSATIFSNINVIRGVNTQLLQDLIKNFKQEGENCNVGQVFLGFMDYMKMYSQFCNNQSRAMTYIPVALQKNELFRGYLNDRFPDYSDDTLMYPLRSYLVKPMQRICKYPLLFRELLKYTEEEHASRETLTKALEHINDIVGVVNQSSKDQELLQKLIDVSQRLVGAENLVQPARRFLKEKKCGDSYVFLFNDLLLVAKKLKLGAVVGSKKMKVKAFIPLASLLMHTLPESPLALEVSDGESDKQKQTVITFASDTERKEWEAELNSLKDKARSNK